MGSDGIRKRKAWDGVLPPVPRLRSSAAAAAAASMQDTPTVVHLWRYAVKGLGRDSPTSVLLRPNEGLPADRRWALLLEEQGGTFIPAAPAWLHKTKFLCAFTAPELLGSFEARFDEASDELTVTRDGEPALRAVLSSADGREEVEAFFSAACGQRVRLVRGEGPEPHHFGNTPVGSHMTGHSPVVHVVGSATVAALSEAAGVPLNAWRFRPNIVVSGVPAWSEFQWVGKTINVGDATLKVRPILAVRSAPPPPDCRRAPAAPARPRKQTNAPCRLAAGAQANRAMRGRKRGRALRQRPGRPRRTGPAPAALPSARAVPRGLRAGRGGRRGASGRSAHAAAAATHRVAVAARARVSWHRPGRAAADGRVAAGSS